MMAGSKPATRVLGLREGVSREMGRRRGQCQVKLLVQRESEAMSRRNI